MKKGLYFISILLFSFLLVSCSQEQAQEPLSSATAEEEMLQPSAVEVQSASSIEAIKKEREKSDPTALGVALFLSSRPIAYEEQNNRYYLTVPSNADASVLQSLSSLGASVCLADTDLDRSIADRMQSGDALALLIYNETAYAEVDLILTSLPILTIDGAPEEIDRTDADCSLTVYGEEGEQKSLASIRLRGGTSAELSKVGYAIELYNADRTDTEKLALLDMRKDDDWILVPMHSDETKIRDAVCWDIWERISKDGAGVVQYRYVEVILNGNYHGLYLLMERFDAKTLNLDENDALFKAITWVIPTYEELISQSPDSVGVGSIEKKYPNPEDNIDGSWDVFAEFIRLVYDPYNGQTLGQEVAPYVDMESLVDYWIFVNLVMGVDNSYKNTFYATQDGKIHAYPWDLDITFGLKWASDAPNYLYHEPTLANQTFNFNPGRRMIKYFPGGADYAKSRWDALVADGVATYDGIMEIANKHWDTLWKSGAYERNQARWPDGNYTDSLDYFSEMARVHVAYMDELSKEKFKNGV